MLVSAAAAAWMQVCVASDIPLLDIWPRLWVIAGALFVVAWTAGRWRPALTRRTTLFLTCLVPVFFIIWRERFESSEWIVWIAMVYGVMLSTRAPFRWSLPRMWRLPLAYWGVLCAVTWPIVMVCESDGELWRVPSAFGAVSAGAALLAITGILWFDWLFSQYSTDDRSTFEGEIVLPLGVGWVVAACLGVYQMFGHITFLNPPFWAGLGRASGPLGDANLLGVMSALWGPALVAVAEARANRTWWWIAAGGLPLSWLAVWASGSRSSMPLVLLGVLGILWGLRRSTGSKRLIGVTAVALMLAAAIAAVGVARSRTAVVGPMSRLINDFQPRWSMTWMRSASAYLWTRNGYGVIAGDMIRQSPLVGVGLGGFNPLVHLYSGRLLHLTIPPDNAQNWFRHQLAELGVIGSMGWLIWCGSFLILLIAARQRTNRLSGTVTRVMMIGFGLISLVGVPGQNIVVALTFWTFAFSLAGDVGRWTPPGEEVRSLPGLAWTALWLLVLAHTAGTTYAGLTYLRPPLQALRADVDYSSGFYAPEDDSEFRWTRQRAVAVLPAVKPWMELTVRFNHADVRQKPVDVKVWANQQLALDTWLTSTEPITRYIRANDDGRRMTLETWVNRVTRPGDLGQEDPRELGLLVRWRFVDAPPQRDPRD
jgi:O-antigen ligase